MLILGIFHMHGMKTRKGWNMLKNMMMIGKDEVFVALARDCLEQSNNV